MHFQVALASNHNNPMPVQAGGTLLQLLTKAAGKYKLKSTKKKPLSLYDTNGCKLEENNDISRLTPGDVLYLVCTEGEHRDMQRLAESVGQCAGKEIKREAHDNGWLPEELWNNVFSFLQPPCGVDGENQILKKTKL